MIRFFRKNQVQRTLEKLEYARAIYDLYLKDRREGKPSTNNFKSWIISAKLKGEVKL